MFDKLKRVKGTLDYFDQDLDYFHLIESVIQSVLKKGGFKEIKTPILEHENLFAPLGESSDIVTKEMYSFLDKKGRKLVLRPEGTLPLMRCFLENHLSQSHLVHRYFYFEPMFRAERPQKGRYRQFFQLGVEVYFEEEILCDFEIIRFAYQILEKLNIQKTLLHLNYLGCTHCQDRYKQILKTHLLSSLKDYCSLCQERFSHNLLRILDCKNEQCISLNKSIPSIVNTLCQTCSSNFTKLKQLLKQAKIPFQENKLMVRGLDYYNHAIFEMMYENQSLCGGGRYNGLNQKFEQADPIPAAGFAFGIERLIQLLKTLNIPAPRSTLEIYLIAFPETPNQIIAEILEKYRNANYSIIADSSHRAISKKLRRAEKLKVKKTLILGEDELAKNRILIKDMESGKQIEKNIQEEIAPNE